MVPLTRKQLGNSGSMIRSTQPATASRTAKQRQQARRAAAASSAQTCVNQHGQYHQYSLRQPSIPISLCCATFFSPSLFFEAISDTCVYVHQVIRTAKDNSWGYTAAVLYQVPGTWYVNIHSLPRPTATQHSDWSKKTEQSTLPRPFSLFPNVIAEDIEVTLFLWFRRAKIYQVSQSALTG